MKEILIEIMIFSLFVSRIRVSAFSIGQRGFRLHRTTAVSRQDTPVGPVNARCRRQSKFPYAWLTTGLVVASSGATFVFCQDDDTVRIPPFDESILSYDHYNGVSLLLDKFEGDDSSFPQNLEEAINFWKAEGRKGIWVHCPTYKSHLIPHCVNLGFNFHFVKGQNLILSQWLPEHNPSKLPVGPTHQVGVGALVLNPADPSKMLVVQEITGPAAAYQLWKMPTGLLDPGEDIPDAVIRELKEETGLDGNLEGIVCFRQAHSAVRSSDLFFVCRVSLNDSDQKWSPQEDEIADIGWMSVEDYCNQETWQGSPIYKSLNDSIRKASSVSQNAAGKNPDGMIIHERLPLGFAKGTNSLFKSQL